MLDNKSKLIKLLTKENQETTLELVKSREHVSRLEKEINRKNKELEIKASELG